MPRLTADRRLTAVEVDRLIDTHFSAIHYGGRTLSIDALTETGANVRLAAHERNLRPGGTVSGPAMFTLADYGVYVAILAHYGEAALQSVTTSITLNFLRRPQPGEVTAAITLMKPGRRLIVAEVEMLSAGRLVAHAVGTYAMPNIEG